MDSSDAHPEPLGDDLVGEPFTSELANPIEVHLNPWTTKTNTSTTSPFKTSLGSIADAKPFLLRHPSKDRDQQGAYRPSRVEPWFPNAHDLNGSTIEFEDRLKSADHRAMKPIEGPDEQHVELPSVGGDDHLVELGPCLHRRYVLGEDLGDGEATLLR